MDTSQWSQGNNNNNNNNNNIGSNNSNSKVLERRTRPTKEQVLNCPRCNSTNTKFCYYNNYSLSQPRYFCKTCRRYWTEGGSLRNVPVGGGSRKNKPSISSPSPSSSITKTINLNPDLINTNFTQSVSQNTKIYQGQDLNLAYPPQPQTEENYKFIELSYEKEKNSSTSSISAMELLKSGIAAASSSSRGLSLSSFMTGGAMFNSNSGSTTGYGNLHDFDKAGINFSVEEFENGYGGGARMLFPVVEELKQKQQQQVGNNEFDEHNRNEGGGGGGDSSVYWNGMLGGGGGGSW